MITLSQVSRQDAPSVGREKLHVLVTTGREPVRSDWSTIEVIHAPPRLVGLVKGSRITAPSGLPFASRTSYTSESGVKPQRSCRAWKVMP